MVRMSSSSQEYQAKIVRGLIEGKEIPTIEELVESIVLRHPEKLKKEEIDEIIQIKTAVPLDESLISATSQALKKLEDKKIVEHISHGYWKRISK